MVFSDFNVPLHEQKMAVPSDTHKKHLSNCGTALQYLKEAGVVLHDDGLMIVEDDIANGDKELTISLLWNMFVHLQVPLLSLSLSHFFFKLLHLKAN